MCERDHDVILEFLEQRERASVFTRGWTGLETALGAYLETYGTLEHAYHHVLADIAVIYECERRERWMAEGTVPTAPAKRVPIPPALRTQVLERDAYRCRRCGGYLELQIDHVVPITRGGATALDNLQTLCGECNRRKHNVVEEPQPYELQDVLYEACPFCVHAEAPTS